MSEQNLAQAQQDFNDLKNAVVSLTSRVGVLETNTPTVKPLPAEVVAALKVIGVYLASI